MRILVLSNVLLAVAVSAGCQGNLPSVPATPPPAQPPTLPAGAALRPYYEFAGKAPVGAGTAFVVADKAGKAYMLTAAHVMDDDAEWGRVKGVALKLMAGGEVGTVAGRPTYLGKAFDAGDAGTDLVVWPLADGAKAAPLKLAAADPKKNEWVWAVGQEPGKSGAEKTYRLKVTGADSNGILLEQHDKFEMRGFSGGPIVNAQGEVVGTLLGGRAPTVIASRVGTVRERLAQANVTLP